MNKMYQVGDKVKVRIHIGTLFTENPESVWMDGEIKRVWKDKIFIIFRK